MAQLVMNGTHLRLELQRVLLELRQQQFLGRLAQLRRRLLPPPVAGTTPHGSPTLTTIVSRSSFPHPVVSTWSAAVQAFQFHECLGSGSGQV